MISCTDFECLSGDEYHALEGFCKMSMRFGECGHGVCRLLQDVVDQSS